MSIITEEQTGTQLWTCKERAYSNLQDKARVLAHLGAPMHANYECVILNKQTLQLSQIHNQNNLFAVLNLALNLVPQTSFKYPPLKILCIETEVPINVQTYESQNQLHLLDIVNFTVDLITVSLAGNQDILESEPMECFRFLVNW